MNTIGTNVNKYYRNEYKHRVHRQMDELVDRHCYHSVIEKVAHHWEIYRYPFFDLINPKIKKLINQEST